MNKYEIVILLNGKTKSLEIASDNEFSALNVVRNSFEYDKILEINQIK